MKSKLSAPPSAVR